MPLGSDIYVVVACRFVRFLSQHCFKWEKKGDLGEIEKSGIFGHVDGYCFYFMISIYK